MAPSTPVCFYKNPFSSQRKQSKIFSSILAFLYCFDLSTVKRSKTMKTTGTWDCACVNHTPSWRDAPIWTGTDSISRFLRQRFQKSPFLPVHTRREAFSKRCVFKRIRISVDGTYVSRKVKYLFERPYLLHSVI